MAQQPNNPQDETTSSSNHGQGNYQGHGRDMGKDYQEYVKLMKEMGAKHSDILKKEAWLLDQEEKEAKRRKKFLDDEIKDTKNKQDTFSKQSRSFSDLVAQTAKIQRDNAANKKIIPDLALQYQRAAKETLSKIGQIQYAAAHTPAHSTAKALGKATTYIGKDLLGLPPAFMGAISGMNKMVQLVAKGIDKPLSMAEDKWQAHRHDKAAAKYLAKNDESFGGDKKKALLHVKERRKDMKEAGALTTKSLRVNELGGDSSKIDARLSELKAKYEPKKEPAIQARETELVPKAKQETSHNSDIIKSIDASSKLADININKTIKSIDASSKLADININKTNVYLKKISRASPDKKNDKAAATSDQSARTGIFGGFIDSIVTMAESFGKFIPTILGIGKNFLRFLRFLGPIGLVASLLMSLDFEKDLVEPIKKIIDTFANGDWIEGISRVITFIPDTIAKGILRFGSWIAEKLGFDGLAETLSGFADNFNIVDMVKNVWTSITTGIGGAISSITDSLSKFSFNIPAFIPDSVLSMTGLPRIIQPFKGLSPTSNMSAPASPPSANVGSVIAEKSTDVADAKNAQQPIVIAPQSTNVNQVSTSTTNAIAMRSRPRSMNESIQRTSRESYSSAGGYSVG